MVEPVLALLQPSLSLVPKNQVDIFNLLELQALLSSLVVLLE